MNDAGAQTRAELALWFIDHDEIDEAARVLCPGDELDLGESDYLALSAALARRGLAAGYDRPRVRVVVAEGLAATPRKPPLRAAVNGVGATKKTA
jgi:hypothetical protein